MPEKPAGKVEHYYPKVQAAAVRLSKKVKLGDKVHIVGHGDDFEEEVTSLQLDHRPIEAGEPGQSVGLWVKDRVHEGDDVLLVTPDGPRPARAARAKPKAAGKPKAKKARAGKAKAAGKSAKRPKARKTAKRASASRKAPRRGKTAARKAPKRGRKAVRKATRKKR